MPTRGAPVDDLELAFLSATELRRLIAARELSPVEVVEGTLRHIERVNPVVNAYVTVAADQARAAARDAERAVTSGEPLGPLHGIPVGIKDLAATAGIRTTYGSRLFADNVPTQDHLDVARLRQAGAIILGKTNTPEFGAGPNTLNALFGATRNPWNLDRSAGGSSGGSAVALACGMGPLAQGSDLGGSLRIPASVCGVVGFRTAPGRIPKHPAGWPGDPFSVVGPMARTVRDTALMLSVMAGPDARVPISLDEPGAVFENAAEGGVRGLRVAWSPDLGVGRVDPEVASIVEAACMRFADAGCTVDAATPEVGDLREMIATFRALGVAAGNPDLLKRADEVDNPFLRDFLKRPVTLSGMDVARAFNQHGRFLERMAAFFEQFDFLVSPTTPTSAYMLDQMFPPEISGEPVANAIDAMIVTYVITMSGLPAISVPAGFTAAGLPVGMQIVGRRHAEAAVLRAAAAFEEMAPWAHLRPPVVA
ncbi:MAG: amidase [Acidobacteria bacterium]|nr:amidase [Acidobacteriota bacterium]